MKTKRVLASTAGLVITLLTHPAVVHAAGSTVELCENDSGIQTALGCISFTPEQLLAQLLFISIGIVGGTAFIVLLLGALQLQISAGDPKRIHSGREMIESAAVGMLLIIFSVFILRLVGVNILQIPGFN